MSEPEKGDKVSWNWGGGAPGGEVVDKKYKEPVSIVSHRGNEIKKKGDPNDPAVHISRSGNDVVKKASELNVEKKGSGSAGGSKAKKNEGDSKGEKRKAEHIANGDPHTLNEDGKEVKKGGKEENKKQKKSQTEDVKGHKSQNAKATKKKTSAPRQQGDMVSTRTRSQNKK